MSIKRIIRLIALSMVCTVALLISSCTDASVVSSNISKAADQFEIFRRVVFYNGITDQYIISVEGYCSIYDDGNQLEVTVKTESGKYLKHFLGLSDNVTYFAEQLEDSKVSSKQYKVIFKPSVIVPNIDLK